MTVTLYKWTIDRYHAADVAIDVRRLFSEFDREAFAPYKRTEYAARGIAEYWIVDPILQQVTILEWVEGLYEEKVYSGNDAIASSIFEDLDLTVDRVLQGK